MNNYNKCDVCGIENKTVKAGRWIFYCSNHKQIDIDKTYENEIKPSLESGDFNSLDGECLEFLENL
jgi:hypothetical protein